MDERCCVWRALCACMIRSHFKCIFWLNVSVFHVDFNGNAFSNGVYAHSHPYFACCYRYSNAMLNALIHVHMIAHSDILLRSAFSSIALNFQSSLSLLHSFSFYRCMLCYVVVFFFLLTTNGFGCALPNQRINEYFTHKLFTYQPKN